MTRKQSLLRMIASAALALLMVFSMAAPALADTYTTGTNATDAAKAAITKRLLMPFGTDIPVAEFTYSFTPVGFNAGTVTTNMPTIADVEISFDGTETNGSIGPGNGGTYVDNDDTTGVKTVAKEVSFSLSNLTWGDGVGIYHYTLTETLADWPAVASPVTIATSDSTASYDIEIWVEEDGSGALYAKYFVAVVDATLIDTYYPGTAAGDKVDPTPDRWESATTFDITEAFSQLVFTNTYAKKNGGGDIEDPDNAVLTLTKTLAGAGFDVDDVFDFKITLANPTAGTVPAAGVSTEYRAYLMEGGAIVSPIPVGTGGVVAAAANIGTDAGGKEYIKFVPGTDSTAGTELTVSLKASQSLAFTDLEVGAKFTVTEDAATDYIPSYLLTYDGVPAPGGPVTGAKNTALRAPGSGYAFIGEAANIAAFTNTASGVTPGGISVDSLPYYIAGSLLALAFVGFIVVKSRKRAQYEAE